MAHAKKMVRKNKVRIMSDANQRIIEHNERVARQNAYRERMREKFLEEYRKKLEEVDSARQDTPAEVSDPVNA